MVLSSDLDAFENFLCSSMLAKTTFCLEEKQGMLVNDGYNGTVCESR